MTGFFIWRVVMVSVVMMAGALGLFLWNMHAGASLEAARTIAVNAVVMAEVFYLFNSRSIYGSVLSWRGLTGNRVVLLTIAACVAFQLAFTYTPWMQAIFETRPLGWWGWAQVLGAGALVFAVTELEKLIIRNTPWLRARFMPTRAAEEL